MKPKLKITGQKELLKKLAAFGDEAERKVSLITFNTAQEIATKAAQNAPTNFGKLKQSINVNPNATGKLFYEVNVNNVPIAAYVEFGTGAFVEVPTEWKDMAWAFYVNGKGWMQPQPYLYPAWRSGSATYERDLEKLLTDLTNKFNR